MAPEWRRSLYDPRIINAPTGIQFLMHMNSHINNDLARAIDQSRAPASYHHDYKVNVGTILSKVALEHAEEYIPLESETLRSIARLITMRYIGNARERAWRDGMELQQLTPGNKAHAAKVHLIEQRALVEGRRIYLAASTALRAGRAAESVALRY